MSYNRCNCPSCNNQTNTWVVPVSYCSDSSYATFWQSNSLISANAINDNQAIPFNATGVTTIDISLINSTTIKIATPGVYKISYTVLPELKYNINLNSTTANPPTDIVIGVSINNYIAPNSKVRSTISAAPSTTLTPGELALDYWYSLSTTFLVEITANSNIQLRNLSGVTISLYNNTTTNPTNIVPTAAITIERI